MELEEAIKQRKPFACPYEKALVNLIYTRGWLDNEMKTYFKSIGVTGKQYNILRILKGADKPVSTSFVRERLLDKLSDVSRIIERMEKKKLVTKCICKNDRRLVDLSITKGGLDILKIAEKKKESLGTILKSLSPEEIELFNTLLNKIRN